MSGRLAFGRTDDTTARKALKLMPLNNSIAFRAITKMVTDEDYSR